MFLPFLILFILGPSRLYSQQSAYQTPVVEELGEPPWVLSDSLCQLLNVPVDQLGEVSKEDAQESNKVWTEGFKIYSGYKKSQDINLIIQSQPYFEKALRLDRTKNKHITAVKAVWNTLQQHYLKSENAKDHRITIRLGERLWRLDSENKRNYLIYLRLGQCYTKIEKSDYALLNFQKAEKYWPDHMVAARSKADTRAMKRLENLMYRILKSQIDIYESDSCPEDVIRVVERVPMYITDERIKRRLNGYKGLSNRWLFWEDREALDIELEIRKLMNNKEIDNVRDLYEKLIVKFPSITDKRRVEAERCYALFEYQDLNQKVRAIERLLPWVMGRDSLGQIENIEILYNNFSQMSLVYGNELKEKDRFAAFCYYKQGLVVPSDFQEKITINILTLCVRNTAELIRCGLELWERRDRLTEPEKRWLCEQLIYAHKQTGDPEATRRFLQEYCQL